MKITSQLLIGIFCLQGIHAYASDLDDCVLNGLRGVNSDAAARMIKQACENKVKSSRVSKMVAKYGEWLDDDLTVVDLAKTAGTTGESLTVKLKNSIQKTILYVELSVGVADLTGDCPSRRDYRHKYLYRVKIKPEANGNLSIPNAGSIIDLKRDICISARAVRGRSPNSLDVNFSTFEPLPESAVKEMNSELNTTYAVVLFIPEPAPKAASSLTDFTWKDVQRLGK